jgi:hypothetical protein
VESSDKILQPEHGRNDTDNINDVSMTKVFSADTDHITREEALKCVFDGWASLINEAYDILDIFNTNEHSITVAQVKEKFGTLRMYTYNHLKVIKDGTDIQQMVDDEVFRAVQGQLYLIEIKSAHICEFCGKEGRVLDKNGWYKCMCPTCFVKDKSDLL